MDLMKSKNTNSIHKYLDCRDTLKIALINKKSNDVVGPKIVLNIPTE